MSIFKLYYYEMKKNKALFLLVFLASILILLYQMFYLLKLDGKMYNDIFLINKAISQGLLPYNYKGYISLEAKNSIVVNPIRYVNELLLLMSMVLLSILLSVRIITRDYAKKNRSYMVEVFLPTKLYKIKLAKILTGLSLYMFASILTFFVIIAGNIICKMHIGEIFNDAVYLNRIVLMNMFLPIGVKSTMIITFLFSLTCIIGVQSLSDIFLVNLDKKKSTRNKLLFLVFLTIGFVFMCIFLFILLIEAAFSSPIYILDKINLIDVFYIVFIIISVLLFTVDMVVYKKRLRGGI